MQLHQGLTRRRERYMGPTQDQGEHHAAAGQNHDNTSADGETQRPPAALRRWFAHVLASLLREAPGLAVPSMLSLSVTQLVAPALWLFTHEIEAQFLEGLVTSPEGRFSATSRCLPRRILARRVLVAKDVHAACAPAQ